MGAYFHEPPFGGWFLNIKLRLLSASPASFDKGQHVIVGLFGLDTSRIRTDGFEWAQSNVAEGLGSGSRCVVYSMAIIGSSKVFQVINLNSLSFEEFVSTKLESTLKVVVARNG
jgi:hypothetical protein